MYKIKAKTLANRLKRVISSIISINQNAFIFGRLITDTTIVVYAALLSMKTRNKGRCGNMALKLDISNAYDRVEWRFLISIMEKLGFGHNWMSLVMQCVSIVQYYVLVNG